MPNGNLSFLYTDIDRLGNVLKSLFALINVKISLFDAQGREVYTYPPEQSDFCQMIRHKFIDRCCECDERGFEKCSTTGHNVSYYCHAGLIDALVPLRQNERIIGFIMFGQMLPDSGIEEHINQISKNFENVFDPKEIRSCLEKLVVWDEEKLKAAESIIEICISYMITNRIVFTGKSQFKEKLDQYIDTHISEQINISDLCAFFNMSRTAMYTITQNCLDCSIMKYIRTWRMDAAKELLITTDFSITEIANKVGFNDYNYFLRVFKNETGTTCARYRKEKTKKSKPKSLPTEQKCLG